MPVYQVYFPESVSEDIIVLAKKDGIGAKEWIQKAVGTAISSRKKQSPQKPEPKPVKE